MNPDQRHMNPDQDNSRGVVREPGPVAPTHDTTRLRMLESLAVGLRAAGQDRPILTWQCMADCTLDAARHGGAPSPEGGALLRRRMDLNHDLDRAFLARKLYQPWKEYDTPTVLQAVADLIAAAQAGPAPHAVREGNTVARAAQG